MAAQKFELELLQNLSASKAALNNITKMQLQEKCYLCENVAKKLSNLQLLPQLSVEI